MFLKYRIRKRNQQILRTIPLPEHGTLLDISSGDGSFLTTLHSSHPQLELFGIDLTEPEYPSTEINFQVADATAIPFPNKQFDIIICSMSLHHYQDIATVFKEINRVLRSTGTAYITDIMPGNKPMQWLYNIMKCSAPYHFEKYYTEQDIHDLVKPMGLNVVKTYRIPALLRLRTLVVRK